MLALASWLLLLLAVDSKLRVGIRRTDAATAAAAAGGGGGQVRGWSGSDDYAEPGGSGHVAESLTRCVSSGDGLAEFALLWLLLGRLGALAFALKQWRARHDEWREAFGLGRGGWQWLWWPTLAAWAWSCAGRGGGG